MCQRSVVIRREGGSVSGLGLRGFRDGKASYQICMCNKTRRLS